MEEITNKMRISYTVIPNEVCMCVKYIFLTDENINYLKNVVSINGATCIFIKLNEGVNWKTLANYAEKIHTELNIKVAIYKSLDLSPSMPVFAGMYDYIVIHYEKILVNLNDTYQRNTARFIEIEKTINDVPKKDELNPADLYYFEMFDEIKELNNFSQNGFFDIEPWLWKK